MMINVSSGYDSNIVTSYTHTHTHTHTHIYMYIYICIYIYIFLCVCVCVCVCLCVQREEKERKRESLRPKHAQNTREMLCQTNKHIQMDHIKVLYEII